MSADNYLYVNEQGEVFEGCASFEGLPDPIHKADTVAKAVAWANGYQHDNLVEYGISLSAEAQRLLGEG